MITRSFLASLTFRVMTDSDLVGFAGVNSPVPLITEYTDEYVVVIDGDRCEVFAEDGPVDACDSISNLSY